MPGIHDAPVIARPLQPANVSTGTVARSGGEQTSPTTRPTGDGPPTGGRVAGAGTRSPRVSISAGSIGATERVETPNALSIHSVQSPAALARANAVNRFEQHVALGEHMNLKNPDVRKAALFQGLNVGVGAAFAFGAGRALGADIAEAIVHAAFHSPQIVGVGEDKAGYDQGNLHTAQMMTTVVARWLGATLGGGIGAAAGNVVAPRMARAAAGRQLLPIPANELVPDHVAELIGADGHPIGEARVAALRASIAEEQKKHGVIVGDTHIRAGQYAFGALNAARGGGQGFQPMGIAPDTPVTALVSATSGLATGIYAATAMAGARLTVPDAGHDGELAAPPVAVPLFRVGDPAAIPDRFSAAGAGKTAANIGMGVLDRTRAMGKATSVLGAAQLTGTAIAAAVPAKHAAVAHRVIQAGVQGAGVWAAVEPWFKEQPVIGAHDAARRAPAATAPIAMTIPGSAHGDDEADQEV